MPARTFRGFEREALQFFHELSLEMNRDWFEANKDRYKRLWVEPMTALLTDVAGALARSYAPVKLGAPKLFRIHRDVRFSKDKTPYKTHAAGMLPLHAKKPVEGGATALYLHLGVDDDEYLGSGTYFFDDKQLPRWRKLVAAGSGLRARSSACGHAADARADRGVSGDPARPCSMIQSANAGL